MDDPFHDPTAADLLLAPAHVNATTASSITAAAEQ